MNTRSAAAEPCGAGEACPVDGEGSSARMGNFDGEIADTTGLRERDSGAGTCDEGLDGKEVDEVVRIAPTWVFVS